MRPLATDVVWSVSMCLFVTTVSPTKANVTDGDCTRVMDLVGQGTIY